MFNVNYDDLNEAERFYVLKKNNFFGLLYLYKKFNNLTIEVLADPGNNLFTLSEAGNLEGWCWETTETAILFMKDNHYIERGYLYLDKDREKYFHSWICFKILGVEYIFDPCFNIVCKKKKYNKIFRPKVIHRCTAKEVREFFIDYIENPPKMSEEEQKEYDEAQRILKMIVGEHAFDRNIGEIVIPSFDDVKSPMFRNGVGYKADIKKGKIKKLVAHYYYDD